MPRFASLVLVSIALGACSPFMADRGRDFAQVLDASVGYSEGFAANVRASKFVQIGLGAYRGVYWAGLKSGELDVWMEERAELGVGPFYVHEMHRSRGARLLDWRHPLYGEPGFRENAWDLALFTDRGLLDVGATLNLVLVGIDVAFKPAQFVDFLAGFAGVDLLEDDQQSPPLEELLRRVNGGDARVRAAAVAALRRRTGEHLGYAIYAVPDQMPDDQVAALRRWREWFKEHAPASAARAAPEVTETAAPAAEAAAAPAPAAP